MPTRELIRLAAAARAAGSRWDRIAAACGIRDYRDITGVVTLPCWRGSETGADLLFSAAQHAVHKVTGSRGLFAPVSWPCRAAGSRSLVEQRLAEVRDRYGPRHLVSRSIQRATPMILCAVEQAHQRAAQTT